MILIADSGSSKTDWRTISQDGQITQFRSVGFNPYYQTEDEMVRELFKSPELIALKGRVREIHFYGAGCTAEKNKLSVERCLHQLYPHATVEVDHDLMAAARATCATEPGIACILGTGSNSGDYDGEKIIANRPSPGYLLGDEGGGCYIGKHFLQDFIYDDIPSHIRDLAIKEFQITNWIIQENIYQKPFPNRYMASFCRFISHYKNDPYCFNLYYKGFYDFFKRHVMRYDNYKNKPVSFVGSIAYYNGDILRKTATDLEIQVKTILETPIAGLTLYHKSLL